MPRLPFNRRISSFFSLLLVFLFALTLATVIIVKSRNLKKLEEPFRFDHTPITAISPTND